MSAINRAAPPMISDALLADLERAYPAPRISHDTPETDIKWAAAQHHVVQWIKQKVGQRQSVPTAVDPTQPGPHIPNAHEPNIRVGVPD